MVPKFVCSWCDARFTKHSAFSRHDTLHRACLQQFQTICDSYALSTIPNALHQVSDAAFRALRTHLKEALLTSTNGESRVVIAKRVYQSSFALRDYILALGGTGIVTVSSRGGTSFAFSARA